MKALALVSGGLDSMLAAKVIKDQGIDVVALVFSTRFGQLTRPPAEAPFERIRRTMAGFGIEARSVDLGEEFLAMLKKPAHGFGSQLNPCIDCKIMMLKHARELLSELGASFVITGEVLGQRPMSQHREALRLIERTAGLEGLLLRPLTALHLPETVPEREGWVKREKLLSISGRSRTQQMELAKALGLTEYPNPAGGCLLTDPGFVLRLKDMIEHGGLTLENVELLKIGRHFRISGDAKLVVGRNEHENEALMKLCIPNDYVFTPLRVAGPTAIARGAIGTDALPLCAAIVARYCDRQTPQVDVVYTIFPESEGTVISAAPLDEARLAQMHITAPK